MEKKVRVFDVENACYGVASAEEFKDNNLAVITVEFYKNKSQKDEEPKYKLVSIRGVRKSNLK
jgi:hypothetical protein